MPVALAELQARLSLALAAAERLERKAAADPLGNIQWLPSQAEWLAAPDKVKLYRAGNQSLGKSTAMLGEAIWKCLGIHPWLSTRPPPVEIWVLCASWPQSLSIQRKLFDLVPRGSLHSTSRFSIKNGWTGRACVFHNGSILRFKTTSQDAIDLAGATLDGAYFDEPPSSPRLFAEVRARCQKRGAVVGLSLTPINAPTDFLRDLVKAGKVADYHYRLTPEALIPQGSQRPLRLDDENRTPCDAAWIRELEEQALPHERDVVVHGEWSTTHQDRVFKAFRNSGLGAHISSEVPSCAIDLAIGMDHGSGASFSEAAVLVGIERGQEEPRIWVLDEYVSDGMSSATDDARGLLSMLKRWGIPWERLKYVNGDRAWIELKGRMRRKGNEEIMGAIVRLRGLQSTDQLHPQMEPVKRGHSHIGAVSIGAQFLHRAMLRPAGFYVRPSCDRTIKALERWRFEKDGDYKHIIDALRYAIFPLIHAQMAQGPRTKLALY